ncbi:MAG: PilC/PilY family type IV pilus protein [Methylococcaceae bacterium]
MNKKIQTAHGLAFAMLIFFSSPVNSDDTEIYLGGGTASVEVKPNVLFVLDTSSSMTSTDGTGITRLQRMKTALNSILNQATNINVGMMRFHGEGGPVLYPVADIDADASIIEGTNSGEGSVNSRISSVNNDAEEVSSAVSINSNQLELVKVITGITSLERRVSDDDDVAEERESNGSVDLYSSDLELVEEDGDEQIVGIRFRNITIPVGSTIQSAEIEFVIDEVESEPTTVTIYGQDASAPSVFSSSNADISSRSKTTSSVLWSNLPTDKAVDEKITTPDLSTVVQEIVDRSDWSDSGNSMVFIITGSGNRTVEAYDDEPDSAPLLTINYTTGSTSETEQLVGLRFQNVGVPQGATITSATIEFEAANNDSEVTALTIKGEGDDDSSAFVSTDNNISSRTQTTASVDWNSIPAWTEDGRYQTPDITSVIQEIVNRSGWCGNNALTLLLEGTGLRNAKSFDESTTAAPKLSIEYDEDSVSSGACINEEFQRKIFSGTDDAEESSDGVMNLTSSDLEMTQEGTVQTIGLRFRNINIPANTTILEAFLEFTVDETDSGTTSLTIKGEDSVDAASFSSTANDITNRPQTTASVSWSPGSWDTVGEKKQSVDIKSIIQEVVNKGSWNSGNALALIISGTGKRVAVSYNKSDGGATNAAVLKVKVQGQLGTGSNTVRDRLIDIVDEIEYKSGTPLVDALFEAALYYRGGNVLYGTTRGNSINSDSSLNRSEYTRVSHPASYTGGAVVREAGCTDSTLNSTECKTEHISGTATYKSPIAQSCQSNHIILLSDGYPSRNSSVDYIESLISPVSCSGSGSGKCGVELSDFLYTNDQKTGDGFDGDQNVRTHTIGFNILADGKTYLEDLATAGGGGFHEASSSTDLVDAFQTIIGDILSHPTSFAAPSLSVNAFNRLYNNNEVYFSLFLPTNKQKWAGNLKKYKVCEGNDGDSCERGEIIDANDSSAIGANHVIKNSAQSLWSSITDGVDVSQGGAGENIPDYSLRRVFTYTGSSAPDDVLLSSSDQLLTVDNSALTKTLLGDAGMTNDDRTDLINWIRGKDVRDEDEDATVDENRWIFSDPLHGSSITIPYGYRHSIDGDGKIVPILDANGELIHITKLIVPGNDGSLRMINSSTGVEEWAFIPQVMLLNQQSLMTNLDGNHIYGLDNTVTYQLYDANKNGLIEPAGTDIDGSGTVETDEKDYVHIYVSMRRGGRNIYAFDVTPSSKLTSASTINSISPKLLWRINGGSGNFSKLGQTWSKPKPAKILVKSGGTTSKKQVLIFAGGYHTDQDTSFGPAGYGNAIYIVDALTGARLWWASESGANVNNADMKYAIPSDVALMDSDSSGVIDRVYVGDTGGQLWRLDLNSVLNNSVLSKLATVSDLSVEASVSNQRKFFYPPDVAQIEDAIYSNTALYDLISITSGNRAHPLDTDVHDRIYTFRDTRVKSSDSAIATIVDNSVRAIDAYDDLFDATSNVIQQGTDEAIEVAITDIKGKKGWFIDFKEYDGSWVGEKGLASPLILDGKLFYTTYVPGLTSTDPCAAAVEGGGRLYAVDMLTGGAVFDWDESENTDLEKEDRRYQLGAGIPSETGVIFQPTGVSVIVGSGGGGYVVDPEVGLPKHRTFWMQQGLE